jgi:uncharacterized protein YjdB
MSNTYALPYSQQLALIASSTLLSLVCVPASAAVSQSKMLVSAQVVEMCSLTLNPSIQYLQAQQFNKLRDASRTSSCRSQNAEITGHSTPTQTPVQVNVEALRRGLYNVSIDETSAEMTLSF